MHTPLEGTHIELEFAAPCDPQLPSSSRPQPLTITVLLGGCTDAATVDSSVAWTLGIHFSMSGLSHLVQCPPSSPSLSEIAGFPSFLLRTVLNLRPEKHNPGYRPTELIGLIFIS